MVVSTKYTTLLLLIFLLLPLADAQGHDADLETIVLQLKWTHQFQFAGYYAAEMQGYFAEQGLAVELVPGGPQLSVADEVVAGRAQYGVLASELVKERALGQPVVLLAVIFQRSIRAIIVRADTPFFLPGDLVGQPIMLNRKEDTEFLAMFQLAGIDPDQLNIIPKDATAISKLKSGAIAGVNGSIANQPYTLQKSGVQVRLIRPSTSGIDYFGDSLFTSEHECDDHPERVAAVTQAVLQGWRYAVGHPEELTTYILEHYQTNKTREQLLFEARALQSVILPNMIDLGNISHDRVNRTFESYVALNLVPAQPGIEGFVYEPNDGHKVSPRLLLVVGIIIAIILVITGTLFVFNRQLRQMVLRRTAELDTAHKALVQEMEVRILAQEEKARSEQLFRNLIESTHAVTFEMDLATKRFTYLGPQTQTLFGHPPSRWKTFDDWFESVHPDDRQQAQTYCQLETSHGRDHDLEYQFIHADGSLIWIHDVISVISENGVPVRAVGFMIDITRAKAAEAAREKLEKSLQQSQKMEAIGMLAGGIAHDLNNLLLPILGHADILAEDLLPSDPRLESVTVVRSAAERARDLVRQLLAFGRKQVLEVKPIILSQVIKDFEPLLRRTIPENIDISIDLYDQSLPVRADVGQIEQVVMNLAVNAQDAMLDGGRLTIETDLVILDADYCDKRPEVQPGQYVMLAISDTGTGMDVETQARAFEPFFSTKGESRGTGLGLASVHGIVRQHGGHIWIYSELGRGTTFKIYFPALPDEDIGMMDTDDTSPAQNSAGLTKGSETILLVEDDPQVREYLSEVLVRMSYVIHIAVDGEEALAKVHELGGNVDLVLTDVIMPGISGREVKERTGESYPHIRFLFMSGYTNNVILHQGVLDDGFNFIQKPFSREGLAVKLREILDISSVDDLNNT